MNWRHDLDNPNWQSVVNTGAFNMRNDMSFINMRNDMSFMEAVFLPTGRDRPSLPYDEFIVDSGRHPTGGGRFEEKIGGHFYAKYEFPNGRKVSVVCGQLFYSRIDAPYEVMFDDEDEPQGYLTDEELMILLAKAIGDQ
jgi:hypothetical protein